MKDLTIDFGWAADPISEQIAAQGLRIRKWSELRVDAIEYIRRPLAGMLACGLLTVAEHSCLIKRALDKLYVLVEEKECY